jgi:hyaluronoglucosaminidase
MSTGFLTGIIEGFYGREWSWSARDSYADFLVSQGLNSYLYCPKSDACLRKAWRDAWPQETASALAAQARRYRGLGLNWGVGLSPYALYRDYSASQRTLLRDKIACIDSLGGNLLAILFDDMPGDCPDLAARQAEIAADVLEWSCAERVLVCPTWYSDDPVLERFFGARPSDYWAELGRHLPAAIDIFWTGPAVCSDSISVAHLADVGDRLGRAPMLWDNYPVNDGAKASHFLHLSPLDGREAGFATVSSGHFCNPMNQPFLSCYPLTGLGRLYGAPATSLADCFGAGLGSQLARDLGVFEARGLEAMTPAELAAYAAIYRSFEHPAAAEVVDWLEGKYRFDPACLTG